MDFSRQTYLESLWSSKKLNDNARFFYEIKDINDILNFSRNRPIAHIEIDFNGNEHSNIQFVIPTMNTESDLCRNITKKYNDYGITFVKSSGQFFNYSRSINYGIESVLGKKATKIIVVSNDDIILDDANLTFIQNLNLDKNFAYCLSKPPMLNEYSGEDITIYQSNHLSMMKEVMDSIMSKQKKRLSLIKYMKMKSFDYANAINDRYLINKMIIHTTRKRILKLKNFADFGVFNAKLFPDFKFDETFINGWEDWDLVYRLSKQGIRFKEINNEYSRMGHASISRVMTKEMEDLHSYLNRIYFSWKHFNKKS